MSAATNVGREVHVSPSFHVYDGGTPAAAPRRRSRNGPVTSVTPDPRAWQAALKAAGGDARRLRVISATEVHVLNEPGQPLPERDERAVALARSIGELTGCGPRLAQELADRVWEQARC